MEQFNWAWMFPITGGLFLTWALYLAWRQGKCKHNYVAMDYQAGVDYGRTRVKCNRCLKSGQLKTGPSAIEKIALLEAEIRQLKGENT